MSVRIRRTAVAVCAAAGALALTMSAAPAATVGWTTGPIPAGGAVHGEREELKALPPADIADLDTVGDQLAYARQAAALPVAERGRAWKNVGPFGQDDPSTYPSGGLRFARGAGMGVAAAVDPRDRTGSTLLIGTMGGLWRTTDAGKTWRVLGDGVFARSAVGAVAIDPDRPNDVYAGTGISFLTLSGDAPGTGVYVSHDSGRTWTRPAQNIRGYGVNAITPTATGVFVGTSHGLFVTTDHGRSFRRLPLPTNATHTGPSTGAYADWVSSIVVEPVRRHEVTVAVGLPYGKRLDPKGRPLSPGNGLYRSKDGRARFTWLPGSAGLTNPGASSDPIGRTSLAYGANGDHPVLWALVQDAGLLNKQQPGGLDVVGTTTGRSLNATNTLLNGLYRSDDDGATWTLKATPESLTASPNDGLGIYPALGYGIGVQAYYNNWLAVDPRDDSKVFFGLEEVFQSVANTGATPGLGQFEVVQKYWDVCGSTTYLENVYTGTTCPDGTPYYGGPATHPDQHVGVIARTAKGIRLYTGNDGGFFKQDSHALQDGTDGFDQDSWKDMNHLASVQPYQVARKPDGEYLTALQDNGGGFFKPGGSNTLVTSGDGVHALATSNPDVFYLSAQGAILYVTKDHGKTMREIQPDLTGAAFTSPIVMDPTDENHLVAAGQDVQETLLGPDTTTVLDPLLYTVVKTDWTQSYDAGTSPYTNPTTKKAIAWASQALDVRGAAVYNAMCGLCRNALGDPTLIHTTVSTNVGKPGCTPKKASPDCWHTAAGKGLPHVAIQAIAIDPQDVRTVYVALNENSNIGYDQRVVGRQRLMVSHDAGEHFADLTGNLPRTNARDIVVRDGRLIVATDFGVFTAPRTGGNWSRLGTGLPAVRVYDLSLDPSGRHLTIAAYGRGVWDLDFGAPARVSSASKKVRAAAVRPAPAADAAHAIAAVPHVVDAVAPAAVRTSLRAAHSGIAWPAAGLVLLAGLGLVLRLRLRRRAA